MRKVIKYVTASSFLLATIFNMALHGVDAATVFGFISGLGFWTGTLLEL